MEYLSKAREEICKDCMFWIAIQNCRACLYNTFKEFDKYSPFSSIEETEWAKKNTTL